MPASVRPVILCIGSVLWDTIGHAAAAVARGDDVPGRVRCSPGGVALNVARALAGHGLAPVLVSAIGDDPEGAALAAACTGMGLDATHMVRAEGMSTDRYVGLEDPGGLIAAVADTRTLDAVGDRILAPLADGLLAAMDAPWTGPAVVDGNLSGPLLARIAAGPELAAADLRVASASPEKAARLAPLLGHPKVTLYLNRDEAARLCGVTFASTRDAAVALVDLGAARAIVTDGAGPCALADRTGAITALPPSVTPVRVTGAGDAFMAAHVAADLHGADATAALSAALSAAAVHVAGPESGDLP